MRMAETKHTTFTEETIGLGHNYGRLPVAGTFANVVTATDLMRCNQGVTSATRVGDKIYVKGLAFKLHLVSGSKMNYRIILYQCSKEDADAGTAFWLNDVPSSRIIDTVNNDRYKILYNRVIYLDPGDHSVETGSTETGQDYFHKMWLPINRTVQYLPNNSSVPKYDLNQINLAVIPYRTSSDITAIQVASLTMNWKMYFKDV